MRKHAVSIQLYDADITDLLNGWQTDILLPRSVPEHLGVFEDLQEQDLIHAIYQRNYSRAYSLLRRLDHTLSPTDAMAACLCALAATPGLMNTLLDHCPPIRSFQFLGVGMAASLLGVALRHDKDKMLDILLKRGADPNGGPTPLTAKAPLEEAFCSSSYPALKRLLEEPDLEVTLTENMLHTWGALTSADANSLFGNPFGRWSSQLLLEKLTGQPPDLFEPLPIPPQLRLGHALYHANYELAAKICELRPLTEQDTAEVLTHYASDRLDCTFFVEIGNDGNLLYTKRQQEIQFLCRLLSRCPDLLQTPQLRSAVTLAALSMPEEIPDLARWTRQLADGPVLLPALPCRTGMYQTYFQALPIWEASHELEQAFFDRWEARLGSRVVPSMDVNTPKLQDLPPDSLGLVLQRVRFVGTPPPEALSAVAAQALLSAPEELLHDLLQPGGLLAREQPRLLLDACQLLPAVRRNLIVPLIRKETDYRL